MTPECRIEASLRSARLKPIIQDNVAGCGNVVSNCRVDFNDPDRQ
jgi:hypothetical protein